MWGCLQGAQVGCGWVVIVIFKKGLKNSTTLSENRAAEQIDQALHIRMLNRESDNVAQRLKDTADQFRDQREFNEAIENYQEALRLSPDFWQAHANLSIVLGESGRYQDAVEHARLAVKHGPVLAALFDNLGSMQRLHGELDSAIVSHQRAIDIDSKWVASYFNLSLAYEALEKLQEAIRILDQGNLVVGEQPLLLRRCSDLHARLGVQLFGEGNAVEAAEHLELATQLNPDSANDFRDLGVVYSRLNRLTLAESAYIRSIALSSSDADVYVYLSDVQRRLGKSAAALESASRAIDVKENLEGYVALANAANDQGELSMAVDALQSARKLDAENINVLVTLYHLKQKLCDWSEMESLDHEISSLVNASDGLELGEPFAAIARTENLEENLKIASAYSRQLLKKAHVGDARPYTFERIEREKICIGYLSSDMHDHATLHLMAGVFREHDRQAFEINIYSYGVDDGSDYRKRVVENCDRFVDLTSMSDREAADRIYRDQVDILVDLKGYTKDSRLGICALRPAPVQVTYLGYPGTSGASFFDYVIIDKIVAPMAHASFYSEKFVYLPDTYQCTDNQQQIAETEITRKAVGLPEDAFVFCSFNRSYKLDRTFFDIWMRLLKRVEQSVLWLYEGNPDVVKRIQQEAGLRDIDPGRLIFASKVSKSEHLKRMQLADLVLDTRIYNGHTTTSDALWAGVPVVALQGDHFASRVSSSLLSALGTPELIVDSVEGYERLALNLVEDREALDRLNRKLQRSRMTGVLFNTDRFVANLEAGYQVIWKRYRSGQKPDHVEV